MALAAKMREDEWEIDFNDTRDFLIENWKTAVELHSLNNAERMQADTMDNHQKFNEYIYKKQAQARRSSIPWKANLLTSILQLDRFLWNFETLIQDLVDVGSEKDTDFMEVKAIDTSPLWNLIYLNVKLAVESQVKLKHTARWMSELRRNLELLISTIRHSTEFKTNDDNSIRLELMEVFDPIIGLLHDSVVYLERHYSDEDFARGWSKTMEPKIKDHLESMTGTVKHLREVNTNSQINRAQESRFFAEVGGIRERGVTMDGVEKAIFPVEVLPPFRTEHFIGRARDIEKIHEWLGLRDAPAIRTYTIYGRRGIGKTQIALEYTRKYQSQFDAVFWIQAETKASLRQSFADIAVALELDGAQKTDNFDESLMRVLRWFRNTQKRWLLIYDNAEREQLLKGYWPSGGRGSMLLTSRSFYNFFDDEHRHGSTVQVFDDDERRDLLLALLGSDWVNNHLNKDDMMHEIEEAAISVLLTRTGGLPIAIHHSARLINDGEINVTKTVRGFMELFGQNYSNLPKRYTTERDPLIRSLDTIWSIAFSNLSDYARVILSQLSLLSPDSILVDLFLPSDQNRLTSVMEFCRTTQSNLVMSGPSIQTVINPSPKLQIALNELVTKNLIGRSGRQFNIHRTVQEAVNYRNVTELREAFDAITNLLFDAFPRQEEGRPLSESRAWCRVWIQHAIALAYRYKQYTSNRATEDVPLDGMESVDLFVELLANCAWYLFEIADYDECLNLIAIATSAATDDRSLTYAHLLNSEGGCYYEQNKLGPSRKAFEACLEIRESRLDPDHAELAIVLGNLGNVETAEGNLDAALEYLERAARIREIIGDSTAVLLAVNYMQIGRVHFLQDDYTKAYQLYQKSEGVLNKRASQQRSFMGSLHFAYGNLEFAQGEFTSAKQSFERALNCAKDDNPLHPLTGAICYKIACTEFEQDHNKKALNYLNKALDIAEVRSGGVVDGTVARILWKQAEVLLDDPIGDRRAEAAQLKENVELRQRELAEMLGVDLRGLDTLEDREKSFDLLVPGYFR